MTVWTWLNSAQPQQHTQQQAPPISPTGQPLAPGLMGAPGFPLNPTLGGHPIYCGVINLQSVSTLHDTPSKLPWSMVGQL